MEKKLAYVQINSYANGSMETESEIYLYSNLKSEISCFWIVLELMETY